jgi:hypothetical protein
MANFTLIPFEKDHVIELIKQGVRDSDRFIGIGDIHKTFAEIHERQGIGFTLVGNGRIVGCGGVEIAGEIGMAWLLFSSALFSYRKTALRVVKTTLDGIIEQEHLTTILAMVAQSDTKAQRWAQTLHFEFQPSVPKVKGPDGREYLTYRRAA